ncbi:MAG TPA: hypothetical protein VJU86_18010 [Pyrinomonadaceae bacterium]|nr:hypothetical protein [Pyrinomonadaceae bacterium]
MLNLAMTLFVLTVLTVIIPITAIAQTFELPEAHAGEHYRVQIEQVLRDSYRLKLEKGSKDAVIQWAAENGDLPPGLSIQNDGFILGKPDASRDRAFAFRLRAHDPAAKNDALVIEFVINVKGGGLRLVKFEGPTLRPVDEPTKRSEASGGGHERNAAGAGVTSDVKAPAPDENGKGNATTNDDDDGENGNANQNPFSSRNRRFIVGFEQAGAASAESEGKPFLDLFLSTPLPFGRQDPSDNKANADDDKDKFARFSIWGNVKLNSTPQQIAALADVTSNAVSAITDGKVNKLTLGFEFVAGPEIRLAKAGRTHVSFIGGFGAVTPLAPKQATQIFKTPDTVSSQAERFFARYPGAKGKEFIAFTTPERDRFLRQYFAGFRFRTYRYDKGELKDQFPGMFDVTFGQNEAVTGGTFHKFVVGLDGFYSLPFPTDGRRFLFLFGSARFKAGGPKVKQTPFILDTAASSVSPTDNNVFLADPTPSNRDNYRIGFGVDLIEIFKKAAGKKKEEP